MSYQGADDEVDLRLETELEFSLVTLTNMVRNQLLIDARKKGNLFGPTWAQKKTPLASKPQTPGTQRVW